MADEETTKLKAALELAADKWTLLIAREILRRNCRSDGIQKATGVATNILSARLRAMEAAVLARRHRYSDRPVRYEYKLTWTGEALGTVLQAVSRWNELRLDLDRHNDDRLHVHIVCGRVSRLGSKCDACDATTPHGQHEVLYRPLEPQAA